MRIIIKAVFLSCLLINVSYAENISAKVGDYISTLIPGDGYTETSIDLRENHKPDFSIFTLRALMSLFLSLYLDFGMGSCQINCSFGTSGPK